MFLRQSYKDWQEAVRAIVTQLLALFGADNTWNGTQAFSARITATAGADSMGDVIVDTSAKGIVLKDSAGVYYRLGVSTTGTLTITSLGSTKP